MTSRPTSQCLTCRHWTSPLDTSSETQTCAAFPKGIPDEIWWNQVDHREPHQGDHEIRWEPDGDVEFPDWAMSH